MLGGKPKAPNPKPNRNPNPNANPNHKAVLAAIKSKWDAACVTTPALCTSTAGANGRAASELRETNALKESILCPMPNLTKRGWSPGNLAVSVSGNGVDWEPLSHGFTTLPEPSPCGLTCTSAAPRGASPAAAGMATAAAAALALALAAGR